MRVAKDQNIQDYKFFLKVGTNKSLWNSPLESSVNSIIITTKDKSFKVRADNKINVPPTAEHNNRISILKPYMNEIARPTSILGSRQSASNIDRGSLGRLPGYIMSEVQSSTNIGQTFDVSVQNNSSTPSNLLRSITMMEEKARIGLQPLTQGIGTHLIRNRSPNGSQDNIKYFLNKRSVSKNVDETVNNTSLPMNKVAPTKRVIRQRETKINKILREIKSNMESEEGSRNESQEKELNRTGSLRKSFIVKIKSPAVKSPRNKESKIDVIENKHASSAGYSKKFLNYRNTLDPQALVFQKGRGPLILKLQDSLEMPLDIKPFVPPPFFRNMKANLSARNREVRQKFAKTVNLIIRKLGLMNLTLDDMINKKPFPMEPYEHNFSKVFIDYVKIGNTNEAETLLILSPYLVYDYDLLKQTALHWAAKRGYTKMIRLLLEKGADPDARDVSGRTPLFVAARASHLNAVKLLLYFAANPMIKSAAGRLAIDYATDLHIQSLLARAYKLHAFLGAYSSKRFIETWKLMDKHEFEVKSDQII